MALEPWCEEAHRQLMQALASVGERTAVLAQWDGDVAKAISHLEAALTLTREIGLPGEAWPILAALGGLYAEPEKARRVYREAGEIIHRLAETIDDEGLRVGFLTAVSVRSILSQTKF